MLGIAALLGGYLVIWHGAHLAVALPFLVLAACPLIHIFMHNGHGHHHGQDTTQEVQPPIPNSSLSKSTKEK